MKKLHWKEIFAPNRMKLKLFAIVLATYLLYSLSKGINESNPLIGLITAIYNLPSPLAALTRIVYLVQHVNLYHVLGKELFFTLSLAINLLVLYSLTVAIYTIKLRYRVENFLRPSAIKIILAILIIVGMFFANVYSLFDLQLPLPMLLSTDYGGHIYIPNILFDLWFWYVVICVVIYTYTTHRRTGGR